ncbi:F-box/kelch-repeat protein At3g23880-like [Alnus glutinosa]|uniref:F-box/kelch-repeat protein At3g23880-like n=1 Tax=Alnus glutinosa TaxID=3517 RepID=UPI002D78221D|nr:F-box/kelch-repeat protein At3g23880-like [Alnus glutinosa]
MAAHYFPNEIISDILLRLPVKSLMRFIGVNKAWFSIINSPTFAFTHLARTNRSHDNHNDRLLLLTVSCKAKEEPKGRRRYITTAVTAGLGKQVTEQDQSIKSFDENIELSFSYKNLKHFEVVGSCNGLVLLKRYVNTLVLWNPLLGKFVTLPKPGNSGYNESWLRSTGWEFGFDLRKNDCKVVKIVCLENNIGSAKVDSLVQVFSLRTGCWRSFRVGVPACQLTHRGLPPVINGPLHRFIDRRPQPFINGAIHWLASSQIGNPIFHRRTLVLSFDISNEILREIMLPKKKIAFSSPPVLSISVYGKSLAVFVASSASLGSLWVMREYGAVKSWTEVLMGRPLPKPLGFTTSDEVLWKTDSGDVASYHPKRPKVLNHRVDDEGIHCFAGSYVESLVLLNESDLATKRRSKKGNRRATKQKRSVIDCLEPYQKTSSGSPGRECRFWS